MIGIVVISHGRMAEGVCDSAKLFMSGETPQVSSCCLFPEDCPEDFSQKLKNAIESVDGGQGVIVLADLYGGTPSNQAAFFLNDRVKVISGMNLTVLLELLGLRLSVDDIDDLEVSTLVESGKAGLVCLNEAYKASL